MNECAFGLLKNGKLLAKNSQMNNKFKIAGLTEALRQDESFSAYLEIYSLKTMNTLSYQLTIDCCGPSLPQLGSKMQLTHSSLNGDYSKRKKRG